MNIAYLITAHIDPGALARLIGALLTPETDFYIHIDKKVRKDQFVHAVEKMAFPDRKQITFIEDDKRVRVNWGGMSLVCAQIILMEEAIRSGKAYDWCINLTGTDYPVWSNRRIQAFLGSAKSPVIQGYDILALSNEAQRRKIKKYWFFDIHPKLVRRILCKSAIILQDILRIERKIPEGRYRFCSGGEYWALPFETLKKVLDQYRKSEELQKILSTAFSPGEMWVHTVLMSFDILTGEQKESICRKTEYQGLIKVAPLHYFEYGDEIKVLTDSDFDQIIASGKMFIRKVRTGVSDSLVERLETRRLQSLNDAEG